MYGPPPDPRQVLLSLPIGEFWALYLFCALLGLGLSAGALLRGLPAAARAALFVLGQVVLLTAPLAAVLDQVVLGSWPTLDKAGSLLFYLDGVHRRVLLDPLGSVEDPAARLIGVHLGHLWVVELFDLVLSPLGAFNAQGLLNVALGWWAASLLAREEGAGWPHAVALGFPFGMGLHVFRDLNWYTVEKSAVGWLALFAVALVRAARGGSARWAALAAGAYVLAAWMNWYLALVGAAGAALALALCLIGERGRPSAGTWALGRACVACALAALPLVLLQGALLRGPQTLGDPERFLIERAIPDSFTLVPLRWNRLELHRALNGVVLGLALWAALRRWEDRAVRLWVGVGLGLFALSLGPRLAPGLPNPVYELPRLWLPGFWRVAKPEVFFEGSYLALIALAARGAAALSPPAGLYLLFPLGWLLVVRSHPVYPPLAEPSELSLDPGWVERSFGPQPP